MKIAGSVALVTGANRGIGRAFARELLTHGATKVYATARRPELIDIPGVETLRVDITDPASVAAAAEVAGDVTLLINNAGISTGQNLLTGDDATIRREFDTHFWGTLRMIRAFAPALAKNGGGAVVNVLSALSWFSHEGANAYAAAKAAEWSLTNGVRLELAAQNTLVTGVILGLADTDLSAGIDGPKLESAEVARITLTALEEGAREVLVDDWSRYIKASLQGDPGAFYAQTPGATIAA